MGMTAGGVLDIILLIYYIPALPMTIFVIYKHGHDRKSGWVSLTILSLCRLIGSILGIAALYAPSAGLIIASLVLSSMGTISLAAVLTGAVERVNTHLQERASPDCVAVLARFAFVGSIVLGILGPIYEFNSDPSEVALGRRLVKAAIMVLLLVLLVAAVNCFYTIVQQRFLPTSERRLLWVAAISVPFIFVRWIYAVCSAFEPTTSVFSVTSSSTTAIVVRALMGVLMEFIVVALYLWAGMTIDVSAERREQVTRRGWYSATDRTPPPAYDGAKGTKTYSKKETSDSLSA